VRATPCVIDDLPPVMVNGGLKLPLRRTRPDGRPRPPVLLLHGASACGDTFLIPHGRSLVEFLWQNDFDVFVLDWRGSRTVTDRNLPPEIWAAMTCEHVIREDLPAVLERVGTLTSNGDSSGELGIVAHCMGAACLAMAIAAGTLAHSPMRLSRVVFSAIGLFYEVSWDGWAKVQDRLLERVAGQAREVTTIHPGITPWPEALEDAYQLWPRTLGPICESMFCRRLAFMYGMPFLHRNLDSSIDDDEIRRQFGGIPLRLYMHAAQNTYRGFAARFDAEGNLPASLPDDQIRAHLAKDYIVGQPFTDIDRVTVLGGAQNPLWHRDSVDRMYDWLRRVLPADRCRKHVLDDYGHQDLWWGRRSFEEVFPLIREALRAQ
jgi:pimeloyl-ACP methyl ester carboxylesterase